MKLVKKFTFQDQLKGLEDKIKNSYEAGVTMDEAEKLAAEFLYAQMTVSAELTRSDLDARMKKSGVKAIRATAYLDTISSADKRPTEAQVTAILDSDKMVTSQQDLLDNAEVKRNELERYYDIFSQAHVYYRNIAKGRFE